VLRTMMKSKIHRATVTAADLHYVGSITIDPELLEAADILEHEQVHVLDIDTTSTPNGRRIDFEILNDLNCGYRGLEPGVPRH